MRYSVRRLRRKLPKTSIMLGCWAEDISKETLEELRETAKADTVAGSEEAKAEYDALTSSAADRKKAIAERLEALN